MFNTNSTFVLKSMSVHFHSSTEYVSFNRYNISDPHRENQPLSMFLSNLIMGINHLLRAISSLYTYFWKIYDMLLNNVHFTPECLKWQVE